MKVDLGVVWSDSRMMWSGRGIETDRELWTSQWEAFSCMSTPQHLDEGQFLTSTDDSVLSLVGTYRRKVERAELVEILKCFELFLMLVKERI